MDTLEGLSNSFFDELIKIGEDSKTKRWLKNTAIIASGYGVGHGLGMLGDAALNKMLGKQWSTWSSPVKKKIISTALGLASAGSLMSVLNLQRERTKANEPKSH